MKFFSDFYRCEEKQMLDKTEAFSRILTHLRFEGKLSRGKNVKNALTILQDLTRIIRRHETIQSQAIFPFLAARLPKHEAAIHFLQADHLDMLRNCEKLEFFLRNLSRKRGETVHGGNFRALAAFFVGCLKHHTELEGRSIYKAVDKELHPEERLEMNESIKKRLGVFEKERRGIKLSRRRLSKLR